MKKSLFLVALIACFMSLPGISFANEGEETEGWAKNKWHEGMEKGDKHGMMMKKTMTKKLVATKDGGIVLLMGNRLIKYDKKLNLVNEVEIKKECDHMKKGRKTRNYEEPEEGE